jgi:hypothetical protein
MRFTREELAQAIAEFEAKAQARVAPGLGYNKDITIYSEVQDVTVQKTSGEGAVDAQSGAE